MAEVEKPVESVIQADFQDKNVIKFMRECAALAKRGDVRSVLIMTVTADDHVDWDWVTESEYHQALLTISLEDAKQDLKAEIFKEDLD